MKIDPRLDLVLERVVDVPPEKVWRAWTEPEHLKKWFCPRPWLTTECEIDLRPGGKFRTLMRGPDGTTMDNTACYLEVVKNQKLVWTSALGPGYRPQDHFIQFTAVITLEPKGTGTRYHVLAMHKDEATAKRHGDMGFTEGWGKALDQLVEMARSM
jgi:uncharacterized protein YndB with AHSA1/START domain